MQGRTACVERHCEEGGFGRTTGLTDEVEKPVDSQETLSFFHEPICESMDICVLHSALI